MAKSKGTNVKPTGGTQRAKILDPAHPPQEMPVNPGGIVPYHKHPKAQGK